MKYQKTYIKESGFTLLEACIALFVVSMICSLNLLLIESVLKISSSTKNNDIYYATSLINRECILYDHIEVNNNSLKINKNNKLIEFKVQDNKIYRQVNNKGFVLIYKFKNDVRFSKYNDNYYLSNEDESVYVCE